MSELAVVGHITRDWVSGAERLGGAAAYGARAAAALGVDTLLLTAASEEVTLLGQLDHPRIRIVRQPSPRITTFELSYAGPARRLWVRAEADPLTAETLRQACVPVAYVGPVVREIAADTLSGLRVERLVLGVQGWLRRLDDDGQVQSAPPTELWALPPNADLVLSHEDHEEADELAAALCSADRVVLITRGAAGVTWWRAGIATHAPAHAAELVDATGAGDVFGVVYALRRYRGDDVPQAVARAQLAAARSVEGVGVGRLPFVTNLVMPERAV